jgi:hypothetical protein
MILGGLIGLGLILGFIGLDFASFEIRKRNITALRKDKIEGAEKEKLIYIPDFKIWGLGAIFGVTCFFISIFLSMKNLFLLNRPSHFNRYFYHGSAAWPNILMLCWLFLLAIMFGIVINAVIKIIKSD